MLQDAVGYPQPAHVGILRRCGIKQAVIAPAKIVGRRRRRVIERLFLQPDISVERMLLAFEFFLIDKLLARRDDPVLRLDVRGIGSRRFRAGLARSGATEATPDARDL